MTRFDTWLWMHPTVRRTAARWLLWAAVVTAAWAVLSVLEAQGPL